MVQCSEKMQTVLLGGSLGRKFGRRHRMTTTGGFRDIMGYFKQFPGFEQHMLESNGNGLRYAVFNGSQNISADDLGKPTGRDEIRIIPVISGSKRAGLLQTIVGVAIVIFAWWNPLGWSAAAALAVGSAGASMALGGAMQMLAPQAKGLGSQDSASNRASYSFNGPVNTSAQGNPVPLLYGRMIVGSAVISAGIYAEDQL